ncbi:FadR/GntR family transcriptional regulator [Novosphingobium aerophilum]|uniref:FadR family transcriptional regulator n=1 Tax=Novosphingobium aerophilum TaxID=2839843 RepID=A0A7X1KDS7_9SPHN|nr:FCD domain-containing protein [Novosphingobium aerophilum]MBC2653583.1 FadR family transcriptional regulator [Novosphingobium aerophilum]
MNPGRKYHQVSWRLIRDIAVEQWAVGVRLPTEKALALRYGVSRGTIGETLTALEVMGLVELSRQRGARLVRVPHPAQMIHPRPSQSEITEARVLFEGEAAALAAVHGTRCEIEAIHELALANHPDEHRSDRAFHIAIAQATHNGAVLATIERLWDAVPISAPQPIRSRPGHDHLSIALLLLERNASGARNAMRNHVAATSGAGCQVPDAPPNHPSACNRQANVPK